LHPKHVERSCSEIKYGLLTAASRWKLIYFILYETRNYLRTKEAKTPLCIMLSQWPSVGVPGNISNSIAESSEFWKQENIYNVLALRKNQPYDALGFLMNGLATH
jgi:hypothetical protein